MTLWELIKAGRAKKLARAEEHKRLENPLDRSLPFGFHIDGKINIDALLPEPLKPLFNQGGHIIEGFSEISLVGYKCFRVLLHHEESDTESYLLVFQKGIQSFARWFVKLDEVYPSSTEDWDFWLNEENGSIGLSQFELPDEGKTLFDRLWGANDTEHIEPICFSERLVLDRFDNSETKVVGHRSMLYGREVTDGVCTCDKLILISACTERDGSYVSIDVGVDLDTNSNIKVVY